MNTEELQTVLQDLIADDRFGAIATLEDTLENVKHDHAARNALGAGFYLESLAKECVDHLRRRGDEILAVLQETVDAANQSISDEALAAINHTLSNEIWTEHDKAVACYKTYAKASLMQGEGTSHQVMRRVAEQVRSFLEHRFRLIALKTLARHVPLEDLLAAPRYSAVRAAWSEAYAARHSGDTTQSAHAAIGAVEELGRLVIATPKASLGDVIKAVRAQNRASPHLLAAVEKLWAYCNDTPGIRHGASETTAVPTEELAVMLDLARAALNLFMVLDRAA